MPAITFILVVAAALCTFVIAAVVVGREARRLDSVAPRSVYIVDEAVEFVAEYLPPETLDSTVGVLRELCQSGLPEFQASPVFVFHSCLPSA